MDTAHADRKVPGLLYARSMGDPQRPAIVFLPGFAGSHQLWNSDFQRLSDRYRLILLDTLGFGRSPKPDIAYSLDDHLAAIHATLHALQIQRMHFVGHSMGSILVLAYAHRYPQRVAKLALLSLPAHASEHEARVRVENGSLFNRLLTTNAPLARVVCEVMCHLRPLFIVVAPWLAHDIPAVVARDALRHTWASYSRTLRHVIFETRTPPLLAATPLPMLVIQGTNDRIAPLQDAQRAVAGQAQIELMTLPAMHNIIFTHSTTITTALARFL